jgi:hypothetical protein
LQLVQGIANNVNRALPAQQRPVTRNLRHKLLLRRLRLPAALQRLPGSCTITLDPPSFRQPSWQYADALFPGRFR